MVLASKCFCIFFRDILNKLDYQRNEGPVYNNVNNTEVIVPFFNSEEKATSSVSFGENNVELTPRRGTSKS